MNNDNNNSDDDIYIGTFNNDKEYKQQLIEEINKIRNEIRCKQERLQYNIFAGVCKNSITAQRKNLFLLHIRLQSLEYKLQHNLP